MSVSVRVCIVVNPGDRVHSVSMEGYRINRFCVMRMSSRSFYSDFAGFRSFYSSMYRMVEQQVNITPICEKARRRK